MEYLVIVAIVVIISLLDDRLRGKKKVPPPTVPQEIPRPKKRREKSGTFEIPPMRGIPGDVQVSADMGYCMSRSSVHSGKKHAGRPSGRDVCFSAGTKNGPYRKSSPR